MKIDQKVYLQKYDVAFITHELSTVPANFMNELFRDEQVFIMSSYEDRYVFDRMFENPETVAWLMDQDWIVDYDQYKDKSPAELKAICKEIADGINISIRDFNNKEVAYRSKHYDEFDEDMNKTVHRLDSIEAIAEHLDGKLEFVFPEQITDQSLVSKPAKKPGFFARLFGRSTQ